MKIIEIKNGRKRVATKFTLPSKTQKQFAEQTNINNIMKKYHAGMGISHLSKKKGTYGDFSNAQDYQSSLNSIIQARDEFATLPSQVRKRFDNDPYELLSFLSDPNNRDEAISLGLIPKPEAPLKINDDPNDDKNPGPTPTPQSNPKTKNKTSES